MLVIIGDRGTVEGLGLKIGCLEFPLCDRYGKSRKIFSGMVRNLFQTESRRIYMGSYFLGFFVDIEGEIAYRTEKYGLDGRIVDSVGDIKIFYEPNKYNDLYPRMADGVLLTGYLNYNEYNLSLYWDNPEGICRENEVCDKNKVLVAVKGIRIEYGQYGVTRIGNVEIDYDSNGRIVSVNGRRISYNADGSFARV